MNKNMFKNNFPFTTSWPLCPPRIETEMSIYKVETNISDKRKPVITINTIAKYDESCPMGSDSPVFEIIITDYNQKTDGNKKRKYKLSNQNPSIVVSDMTGNKLVLSLDYPYRCVYFQITPQEPIPDYDPYGAVLFNWGANNPPKKWADPKKQANKHNKRPGVYPQLFASPGDKYEVDNIIDVYNCFDAEFHFAFRIKTTARFEYKTETEPDPEYIQLDVSDNKGAPVDHGSMIFTKDGETEKIVIPNDDFISGLETIIRANFSCGCVYFDDFSDDSRSVLKKAKKEEGANDFPLRMVRIYDWRGQRLI